MKLYTRQEGPPTEARVARKKTLTRVLFVEEPFAVETHEGVIKIDESTDGWRGGYWIAWPADGSAPYSISPEYMTSNYEIQEETE